MKLHRRFRQFLLQWREKSRNRIKFIIIHDTVLLYGIGKCIVSRTNGGVLFLRRDSTLRVEDAIKV